MGSFDAQVQLGWRAKLHSIVFFEEFWTGPLPCRGPWNRISLYCTLTNAALCHTGSFFVRQSLVLFPTRRPREAFHERPLVLGERGEFEQVRSDFAQLPPILRQGEARRGKRALHTTTPDVLLGSGRLWGAFQTEYCLPHCYCRRISHPRVFQRGDQSAHGARGSNPCSLNSFLVRVGRKKSLLHRRRCKELWTALRWRWRTVREISIE